MSGETITTIGALLVALVSLIAHIVTTRTTTKSEEQKLYKSLLINLALENYKEGLAMAKFAREINPKAKITSYPLDGFVIHMSILADMVIKNKVSPENIEETLLKLEKASERINAFYESRPQRIMKP